MHVPLLVFVQVRTWVLDEVVDVDEALAEPTGPTSPTSAIARAAIKNFSRTRVSLIVYLGAQHSQTRDPRVETVVRMGASRMKRSQLRRRAASRVALCVNA